tara:strand:+ start:624 stop:1340 length:717 start_codon:yes stop_codon:yes gene_type:complete
MSTEETEVTPVVVQDMPVQIDQNSEAPLLQMAIQSGASIDTIERMVALHERSMAAQAKTDFFDSLSAFQKNCPLIERGDDGHNCKYAKLEHIVHKIRNNMAEAGLSHRFEHATEGGAISVCCVITHVSGHSEKTSMSAPADDSGKKNPIQALGSSVTYLQRYTLCGALGIVIGGIDNDGGTPDELVSDKQIILMRELLDESDMTEKEFLHLAKIKALADLPENLFDRACKRIKDGEKK